MYKDLINEIQQLLLKIDVPELCANLLSKNAIKKVNVIKNVIYLDIYLKFPLKQKEKDILINKIDSALLSFKDKYKIEIRILWDIFPCVVQNNIKKLPNVKNIIAIASTKGGVGKSTFSVNFALSLKQIGAKVGILDADLYSPSIPLMLGVNEFLNNNDQSFKPIFAYDMPTMSIGYLINQKDPVALRGPMLNKVFLQLMNQTQWPNLDFLVVDLPPGTGDIQLTLSKAIPLTGVILITTPAMVTKQSVSKSIELFSKLNVNVLGIVENMSCFRCQNCNEIIDISKYIKSKDKQNKLLKHHTLSEINIDFLGKIHYDLELLSLQNEQIPIVESHPEREISKIYGDIAAKIGKKLSKFEKNLSISTKTAILI